jgi:hypothetical protein
MHPGSARHVRQVTTIARRGVRRRRAWHGRDARDTGCSLDAPW